MLRWHPDRHAGAPWAVAKARRVLDAAAAVRARSASFDERATSAEPARSRTGRRRWSAGREVLFYPILVDYWSDWGSTPPSPADAALFQARCAAAAREVAARRAAAEADAAAAQAARARVAEQSASMVGLVVALTLALTMMHSGHAEKNMGNARGAAAAGDCFAQGGGWCRFR
jgi:hypothetical protein